MPLFVPEDTAPQLRVPTGVEPPNLPVPTLDETAAAAFRRDNPLVNVYRNLRQETFPDEPGHNPMEVIRGTKFEQNHLDLFVASRSEAETRAIMSRIEREDEDRRILDASGWAGTVIQVAAGVLDPTIALPAGTIVRGARGGVAVARSAASVGAAAGTQAAVAESILQATQETRTAGESAMAIGSATILGAFLGGGVSLLGRGEREALVKALDTDRAAVDAHAGNVVPMPTRPAAEGGEAAAAAAPEPPAPVSSGLTAAVGAAATDTRKLELVPSGMEWSAKLSPTRRTLGAESIEARRTMADLAETPYRFKDAETATNGPALDRIAKQAIDGTKVAVADELDRLFSDYRFGEQKSFAGARAQFERFMGRDEQLMTYGDFKREVSKALQEGDKHDLPQVQQAAQFVRNRVFEPWKKRAIEAGIFSEDVSVKTAESYFTRVYNKEIINARRGEFVDRVTGWLKSDQDTKRQTKDRLIPLNRDLQAIKDSLKKAKTPERLAALQAEHDRLRLKIEEEIAAWEGKSVKEAKSALKAREKYAEATAENKVGRGPADRLEAADDAIDRAVKRIIESDRDLDDANLRARGHEITDRILGTPDGRLPYDIHTGGPEIGWKGPGGGDVRGGLNARQFAIPDSMIREFLEDDVEQVVGMHLRTVVPDVLLTERFGDVRMTERLKLITEDYARRIDAATSEKARKDLGSERDAVIRDIAAVRDRVRGVYGWSPDLKNMARVATGLKTVNNLTSMGAAALSSIPDMAGVVFRHGFTTSFADGWSPFFRYMTGNLPEFAKFKTQMRALGIGVETAINARQHAIDDVMDVYRPQSRFERTLQSVNDKFFIANLLAPMTDAQKMIAAHVSTSEILRASKAAAEGKATPKQIGNLAEAGVDQAMAGRIWRQFQGGGEVINGVHLPNTADWVDQEAARALNGAVGREVDIAVVTPGQEKALWMSQPVLSLLGQFKSFTAAATERILVANLQRRDASALSGAITAMALGMVSYKLNSVFGGQETSDRPQDWFKEGISRSGLMGWLEEGNALASKMTRGGADVYRLIGADKPLTRFASRSVADMFLGPTVGKITGLAQISGAAASGEWAESDTKALRRLFAFQNLFYIRGLLNQVEEGVNGTLGIEPR